MLKWKYVSIKQHLQSIELTCKIYRKKLFFCLINNYVSGNELCINKNEISYVFTGMINYQKLIIYKNMI